MWPYYAIEKKAKSGRLKGHHQPVGDSEEQSVHLYPEELKYILDIRPPHGSPDFPEENLNYVRKDKGILNLSVLRDDTWLFRFTTAKSIFPNGDKMVYGLWDVAPPVGHPSWNEGSPTIEGSHLSRHNYTATEGQQIEIRQTISEGGEEMYTYQILESNHYGAINNKVVRV